MNGLDEFLPFSNVASVYNDDADEVMRLTFNFIDVDFDSDLFIMNSKFMSVRVHDELRTCWSKIWCDTLWNGASGNVRFRKQTFFMFTHHNPEIEENELIAIRSFKFQSCVTMLRFIWFWMKAEKRSVRRRIFIVMSPYHNEQRTQFNFIIENENTM